MSRKMTREAARWAAWRSKAPRDAMRTLAGAGPQSIQASTDVYATRGDIAAIAEDVQALLQWLEEFPR